jgi:hypothetical protein
LAGLALPLPAWRLPRRRPAWLPRDPGDAAEAAILPRDEIGTASMIVGMMMMLGVVVVVVAAAWERGEAPKCRLMMWQDETRIQARRERPAKMGS